MNPSHLAYIRHLSKQDTKTLSQKALKTSQEVGDLARVVLAFDNAPGARGQFVERERILEEAIDTVLCSLSLAYDLDFTDQEVEEMMERKIDKWALLQLKEKDVVYPLPYEIHITVGLPSEPLWHAEAVEHFKSVCAQLSVKPIVIDLETAGGTTVMVDVMTSSKHYGNNRSAYMYASDLAAALAANDLLVLRTKIETVPWHPMAPVDTQPMPPNCYFEAHIPITLPANKIDHLRRDVATLNLTNLHASRNAFKRTDGGQIVHMLTLRERGGTRQTFERILNDIVEQLSRTWTLGKVHTEFSVYDTKISHDNAWITSK